ncbi:hypothetical protein [uncultured Eubacterium sp.]|uniref:hypothetical protein n=1 Tax=uncultured Eubacterium sp. TaxID=165185 RepID=UPI003266C73C
MRIIDNLEQTEPKEAVSFINSYGNDVLEMFKKRKSFDEVKKVVEASYGKSRGKLDLRILKRKNFFIELLIAINLLKNKLNDEYIIDDNMDFLKKIII